MPPADPPRDDLPPDARLPDDLRPLAPARLQLATVAIILGTFLFGVAAGVGLAAWRGPRHGGFGGPFGGGPHPHHHGPPPMGLPLGELDLTPEQQRRAEAVMEAHRAELDAIVRETFPRVRAVHEQVEREILPLLTPAQQARLAELKARRPPPPPPPGDRPPPMPGEPPPSFGAPPRGP